MKLTNIVINTITKILTMLLAVTYAIGTFIFFNERIIYSVLGWTLSIFIFMTSIVDMFRVKKIDLKYNILNLVLVLLMLFNIYVPLINPLLLDNLVKDIGVNINFSYFIFEQNFTLITIFMIILFVINFNFKTKS